MTYGRQGLRRHAPAGRGSCNRRHDDRPGPGHRDVQKNTARVFSGVFKERM